MPSRGRRGMALTMLVLALGGCSEIFPKRSPGEKLYRKHCANCHGADGSGHTVSSMGDPNANLLDDHWKHPGDAAGMETVLRNDLVFEHPRKDRLSNEEVKQVITYVLSLRGEIRR